MAFAYGPATATDAELLARVRNGDPECAARLWVREWPHALTAARGLVEPAEVPGLAAEALIGTVAAIAVGSGPSHDVAGFVAGAVRELCEDEAPPAEGSHAAHPDVFTSGTLRAAFEAQPRDDRRLLWAALVDVEEHDRIAVDLGITAAQTDAWVQDALGRLQEAYLRRHAATADSGACVDTHAYLGAATDPGSAPSFPAAVWVHLSDCAVCTEAFHELAHTASHLGALLGPEADPGPLVAAPQSTVPLFADAVDPSRAGSAPAAHEAPDGTDDLDALLLAVPAAEPPSAEYADGLPIPWEPEVEPLVVAAAGLEEDPAGTRPKRRAERARAWGWRVPVVAAAVALVLIGGIAMALGAGGRSHHDQPAVAPDVAPTFVPAPTPTASATGRATPRGARTTSPAVAVSTAAAAVTSAVDAPTTAHPTKAPVHPRSSGTPTRTPTRTPTGSGPATPTGAPTPPPSSPPSSPAPSATPTPCNDLAHLLGFC